MGGALDAALIERVNRFPGIDISLSECVEIASKPMYAKKTAAAAIMMPEIP